MWSPEWTGVVEQQQKATGQMWLLSARSGTNGSHGSVVLADVLGVLGAGCQDPHHLLFPNPEFNAHLTASRRLNSHVTSWRGFSREQLLDSFTVEHDRRDVTDGMWSPRKLSPDVISKSVQSLITVSKKLECEVQPVS